MRFGVFVFVALLNWVALAPRANAAYATVKLPAARQVLQRNNANFALLPISGFLNGFSKPVAEVRCTVLPGGSGKSQGWQPLRTPDGGDPLVLPRSGSFTGSFPIFGGGWYRVELRIRNGDAVVTQSSVSEIGVGEIFISAGQSNASNYGEALMTPRDDRVAAWVRSSTWRAGYDPQPVAGGNRGSIYPVIGDLLVQELRVPVGFMSLGYGGSTVATWLPNSLSSPAHFSRLSSALAAAGPNGVRAVLWHQGESDVKLRTPGAAYSARLNSLIHASSNVTHTTIPWFVATATYVPLYQINADPDTSVHTDEAGLSRQRAIIAAAQQASVNAGASDDTFAGPTTDDLIGGGWRHDNIHFREVGLREHARRWADILLPYVRRKVTAPMPITIDAPLDGSTINTLPVDLGGLVQYYFGLPNTSVPSVGTPRVEVHIIRRLDNRYWTGVTWTTVPTSRPATVSGNKWVVSGPLPTGGYLLPGRYTITARASDTRGNTAESTNNLVVSRGATVTIAAPLDGGSFPITPTSPAAAGPPARYNALVAARGTANDSSGRSARRVTVRLQRKLASGATGYWGGGANWNASYNSTINERTTNGTFNWSILLPTLEQGFVAGDYDLRATGVDGAGNKFSAATHFIIRDACTLGGRIVDSNYRAVANVSVTMDGTAFPGSTTSTRTNNAGYFAFPMVPAGIHKVTPLPNGFTFQPRSRTVTVVATDVSDVNFTATAAYDITGRLTTRDAQGNSVALPGVTVSCRGTGITQTVKSGPDGTYSLGSFPSGTFVVTPAYAGLSFNPPGRTVTLNGSSSIGNDFNTGVKIEGRVANATGLGLSGVTVSCFGGGNILRATIQTDLDGGFRFINIPDGDYLVVLGAGYTPEARSVHVAGVDVTGQNFNSGLPGFILHGRVTTSGGLPMANIPVTRSLGAGTATTMTNSSGTFQFNNVPSGTYTLAPQVPGFIFAPPTRTVIVAGANSVNHSFVGNPQ